VARAKGLEKMNNESGCGVKAGREPWEWRETAA
jgi:hypothetical protein